jgi:hypothetical protein
LADDDSEESRFLLAERLSQLVYPKYKFSEFGRLYLEDENFLRLYEMFVAKGTTNYHSLDRKYVLDQFLKLVADVEGDTAECGAYKGASSFLICRRILESGKKHHVFDSFEGLSAPDAADGSYWKKGDLCSGEDEIRRNLRDFDFVVYHKGWIPERFRDVSSLKFCFIHLDTDLYMPTRDSLVFFYERLNPGGVIICDDYGFKTCPGAHKAFESFFSDKCEKVIALPTGQAFIVKKGKEKE